jgi:GldM C-terminal domain
MNTIKNIILFILFISIINKVNAQAAVSNDHENTLFIGVDNPLQIAIQNEDLSVIDLEAMGSGIVITGGSGRYIARVTAPGGASIKLFCTKNGFRELLGTFDFRVKRLSPPIVTLNGRDSRGNITSTAFKAINDIKIESYEFDGIPSVIGFDLTMIAPDKTVQKVHVIGGIYNAEALRLRNMAVPNTIYFFENIKTKISGFSGEITAEDMRFFIK